MQVSYQGGPANAQKSQNLQRCKHFEPRACEAENVFFRVDAPITACVGPMRPSMDRAFTIL